MQVSRVYADVISKQPADYTDYSIIYAVFSKKFFKEFYSIPFDYYYLFS